MDHSEQRTSPESAAGAAPEPWLRGPVPGIPPILMPAAHALMQAAEDIPRAASSLTPHELWARPGGAASVGFHLRHVAGSIDRLLTYARGASLERAQIATMRSEGEPGEPPADAATLLAGVSTAIERVLGELRSARTDTLFEPRGVGRAQLPTNVFGLLVHIAEHTQRHSGQIIATAKIVRALGLGA